MRKIVFATNNSHKLDELRAITGGRLEIVSLRDIGCNEDIAETSDTLQGNALQKARYVREHYGYDCFADDTGLMVDALGGEPGVYSARYAGEGHDSKANMAKLLKKMEGVEDRKARFVTVIALIMDGEEHLFSGCVEGEILKEPVGTGGFGYDPVFKPLESEAESFAVMTPEDKNAISHRGRATAALMKFIDEKIK